MEVSVLDEVVLDVVEEDTDTIPSHVLALGVEVEILVVDIGEVKLCHLMFVGFFDWLLVTFVVDQVHEVYIAILGCLL